MDVRKWMGRERATAGSKPGDAIKYATYFILLLGAISLFADMSYEGAKSISGNYLETLGATAAIVSLISGFGEFIGYASRVVFGRITDRTGRYWTIIIIGYTMNLVAIPLLAFAGDWFSVGLLIVMERMGKAIRAPARDAMISHAATKTGRGWAFGVQEALSSVGAMLGPVMIILVFLCGGSYSTAFLILGIPAIVTLIILYFTYRKYPAPQTMEPITRDKNNEKLPKRFWLYAIAAAFLAAGYIDFPLVSYHLETYDIGGDSLAPLLYALAMGMDAVSAMVLGKYFDKIGPKVLLAVIVPTAFFPIFAFTQSIPLITIGMILFGLGMGAQESVMRALVADLAPAGRRASAYGYYNTVFGSFWFVGSVSLGMLYDISIPLMMAVSVALQLICIPLFLLFLKNNGKKEEV